MQDVDKLFIGGDWVPPATDEVIEVISPHTEAPIARVAAAGAEDLDRAVAAARAAFDEGPWPRLDPAERIEVVRQLAKVYGERRSEMADILTAELGTPTSFANRAQVGLPWNNMTALADVATTYPWQESRPGVFGQDIMLRKEPVGVVAAVIPWNMPQFLIVTKLVPALLAGCTVVVKPAPESPLDALLLAEMLEQIGLPSGVVSIVPAGREEARTSLPTPAWTRCRSPDRPPRAGKWRSRAPPT